MYFYSEHISPSNFPVFNAVWKPSVKGSSTVKIKLNADSIDVYYEVDDINSVHDKTKNSLFKLPVHDSEQLDFFLLNAFDFDREIEPIKERPDYILEYYKVWPNKQMLENRLNNPKLTGIHEFLLCLFDELENPESEINKYCSIRSRQVKENLEKSDVYRMIRKKANFYANYHEWLTSGKHNDKIDEVNVFLKEYSTAIIRDDLSNAIPPYKFGDRYWFMDPQEELMRLNEINSKHNINPHITKDIQNYFLKKHALLSALKISNKNTFNFISVFFIASFLIFSTMWLKWMIGSYEYSGYYIFFGSLFFIIPIILILSQKNSINLILPRILITLSSVMFILIGSEDIFKNQFTINRSVIPVITIGAFIIIFLFFYSEAKQHSPHFQLNNFKGLHNFKILPVFVYAFTFCNFLLLIIHFTVSEKMVENSGIFETETFKKQIDNLDDIKSSFAEHRNLLNDLKNSDTTTTLLISKFLNNKKTFNSYNLVLSQLLDNKDKIQKVSTHTGVIINLLRKKYSDTLAKDTELYNNQIKSIDSLITILSPKTPDDYIISFLKTKKLFIDNINYRIKYSDKFYGSLVDQITFARDDKKLIKLISYPDLIISNPNDSTLISNSKNYFRDYLLQDSLKNIYFIQPFYNPKIKNDNKLKLSIKSGFFQNMLMLHVIITMLLALVGQLIISDKTITEPL